MRAILLCLQLTVFSGLSVAAEDTSPRTNAEEVSPFIDDLTRAVGCIDLTRVSVGQLMDLIVLSDTGTVVRRTPLRAELEQGHRALLAVGVERLYFVVTLAEMPRQPCFILAPCPDGLDPKTLASKLPADLPRRLGASSRALTIECFAKGDSPRFLFIGLKDTLERLKRDDPQPRPELATALEVAGDTPVCAVLMPTDDDRRVAEELLPRLPEMLGGAPSTVLTRGLQWAVACIELEPEPSVKLVVKSADPQAANGLHDFCHKMLARMSQAEALLPKVVDDRLILTLETSGGGLQSLQSLVSAPIARQAIDQTAKDQLRRIAVAMHNWHATHGRFPAQANYDNEGRPLLSWRVHLLPFLGGLELHKQFHLNEPWDSQHNRMLLKKMPTVYVMPDSKVASQGSTCYLRPVGPATSCPGKESITFRDITDGTSNTVLVIEVDEDHAVPWTKPEDLEYDPEVPTRGLGGHIEGTARTVLCDGSPRVLHYLLTDPLRKTDLRAIFTRNGGEYVHTID